MTIQTIESKDFPVGDLFKSFYVVPDYQREYVWEERQVEQLLQDLIDEYSFGSDKGSSEYFIGSIVVCSKDGGIFELIDGQQRITTIFLLFCAIRDHLQNIAPGSSIETIKSHIASMDVDREGEDVFRYRVQLQYEDSYGVLEKIAGSSAKPEDLPQKTRSVTNILNAYSLIRDFLRNQFRDGEKDIRKFYAYIVKNVKLIRVNTASVAHALKIFETINDRGVGLDSMDLLKNLMFMQAKKQDFDTLKDRWKRLVDTLYRVQEKPLRFLRYFILSEFDVDRLREDEIYEWFVRNEKECGYKNNPLPFIQRLLNAAETYGMYLQGKDPRGLQNRYLKNIAFMSGAAKQHLILLLAGRNLKADDFEILAREVENLFFCFVVAREPTREFERNFTLWAKQIRQIKDEEGLRLFIEGYFLPAKKNLSKRFQLAFQELSERAIQKYRMKYILAKLTQYVNEQAWGAIAGYGDLESFTNGVEVEHILPQTPTEEVMEAFDKKELYDEYVHKLGNLTLVEKTINCSVGNGLFKDKQPEYFKSNFLLTKSLGGDISVGKSTMVNRIAQDLVRFDKWQSQDIQVRQVMLTRLAHKTWDVPQPVNEDSDRTAPESGSGKGYGAILQEPQNNA